MAVHGDHLRNGETHHNAGQPLSIVQRKRGADETTKAIVVTTTVDDPARRRAALLARQDARAMHYTQFVEEKRKRDDYMWRLFDFGERDERCARLRDLCAQVRARYGRSSAAHRHPSSSSTATMSDEVLDAFDRLASDACDDRCAQDAFWFFGMAMMPGVLDWLAGGGAANGATAPPAIDRGALERFVRGTLIGACDRLLCGTNGYTVEEFARSMRAEYVSSVGLATPSVAARIEYESGDPATAVMRARAAR